MYGLLIFAVFMLFWKLLDTVENCFQLHLQGRINLRQIECSQPRKEEEEEEEHRPIGFVNYGDTMMEVEEDE